MASLGPISASVLNAGGSKYAATNTFKVNGGNGNALGTVDTVTPYSGSITAVSTVAKRFTVAGDHTANLPVGGSITITGSTGNDGTYTIVSAAFSSGSTNIVVSQVIPDPTADGTLAAAYGPVATYHLTADGSGYASATAVTTTTLTGSGSGLTIDITADGTSVGATVVDSDGTAWAGAAWSAEYVSSQPGQPSVGGLAFTQSYSGTLDGSGVLAVSLTPSDTIFPTESKWRFKVTPATSGGPTYSVDVTITGATQDISTEINDVILPPRITGLGIPLAYADVEVDPSQGAYLRLSDGVIRYWTGSAWASVATV